MLASELLAEVHGTKCSGPDSCHWCGAACERTFPHDEPVQLPFRRNTSKARCPGNHYVCLGCQVYRRPRVTLHHLKEGFKDGQCLQKHSWWLTPEGVRILREEDYLTLYQLLLAPPHVFCLALKTSAALSNELHLTMLNETAVVKAETPLSFMLDNVPMTYNSYELEHAIRHGVDGKSPGTQQLLHFLGKPPILPEKEKNGKGRPVTEDNKTQKLIRVSGQPLAFKKV